jgi:hypothetical protein
MGIVAHAHTHRRGYLLFNRVTCILVEVYSQRLVKFKQVLKIISILFLIWAVFSKIDGMDGAANVLLFISGSIVVVILIAEYAYGRLVKWSRSIQSI